MKLILLRHGEIDAASQLTAKGVQQARRAGRWLYQSGIALEMVYSSPKSRAIDTRDLCMEAFSEKVPMYTIDELKPTAPILDLIAVLKAHTEKSILLVGHLPSLARLIAYLIPNSDESAFELTHASLTILEVESFTHGGAVMISQVAVDKML